MPTITNVQTWAKYIISDTHQITRPCCKDLVVVDEKWEHCPFCGEKIERVIDAKETEFNPTTMNLDTPPHP